MFDFSNPYRDAYTEMQPGALTSFVEVDDIFADEYLGAADGYDSRFARVRPWYDVDVIPDELIAGFSVETEAELEARIFEGEEDEALEAEDEAYYNEIHLVEETNEEFRARMRAKEAREVANMFGLDHVVSLECDDDVDEELTEPENEIPYGDDFVPFKWARGLADFLNEPAMPLQSSHRMRDFSPIQDDDSRYFCDSRRHFWGRSHGKHGRFKKRFPWSKKAAFRRSNDEWLRRQNPAGGPYFEKSWIWYGEYADPMVNLGGILIESCGKNAAHYDRLLKACEIDRDFVEANWSGYEPFQAYVPHPLDRWNLWNEFDEDYRIAA